MQEFNLEKLKKPARKKIAKAEAFIPMEKPNESVPVVKKERKSRTRSKISNNENLIVVPDAEREDIIREDSGAPENLPFEASEEAPSDDIDDLQLRDIVTETRIKKELREDFGTDDLAAIDQILQKQALAGKGVILEVKPVTSNEVKDPFESDEKPSPANILTPMANAPIAEKIKPVQVYPFKNVHVKTPRTQTGFWNKFKNYFIDEDQLPD